MIFFEVETKPTAIIPRNLSACFTSILSFCNEKKKRVDSPTDLLLNENCFARRKSTNYSRQLRGVLNPFNSVRRVCRSKIDFVVKFRREIGNSRVFSRRAENCTVQTKYRRTDRTSETVEIHITPVVGETRFRVRRKTTKLRIEVVARVTWLYTRIYVRIIREAGSCNIIATTRDSGRNPQ